MPTPYQGHFDGPQHLFAVRVYFEDTDFSGVVYHARYLHMIADIYRGGPVGVEALAAGLSEPRDTIEDVVEPYLLQLGLIARTARGRCLNAPGWKHLGLNPPAGSQDGLFDT